MILKNNLLKGETYYEQRWKEKAEHRWAYIRCCFNIMYWRVMADMDTYPIS